MKLKLWLNKRKEKEVKNNMPQGDKTGPAGQGPMTGRKMGSCASRKESELKEIRFGRGLGLGMGRGSRGRGFGARNA